MKPRVLNHTQFPITSFTPYERQEIEQSVTDRFETTVQRYPERLAVNSRSSKLSYAALNRAANSVAHAILEQRGRMEEPIGLLLEQEHQAIIAILGVLKAGRYYVPLDPSYPRDRLRSILWDCRLRLVITDHEHLHLAKRLVEGLGDGQCAILRIDQLSRDDRSSTEDPGLVIAPDAIAAIFYTSGTTGRPKGVIQSHRNVLHRVMVETNYLHIGPEDRLSLLTSPSYSVSLRHLFGALLNGAAVCPFNVVDEGLIQLANWLSSERISFYFSVPTLFRQLATSLTGQEDFSALRVIDISGEMVTSVDVELYKRHFASGGVLVNSFACNEAGIISLFIMDKSTFIGEGIVPVGYGVDDKEILVLDKDGREVGCNEVGQVAVRSSYLSPGYWGQPELTAAAFRPDPDMPGKRIYVTGDLGSLLPDGCLLYKGRKESRVKIRGMRVETAEVEATLHTHASVQQAHVVPIDGDTGEAQLVAYVVLGGAPLTAAELRGFLLRKLPNHMVPSRFVFLDAMPQTPNGKVDLKALPPADANRAPTEIDFMPPHDAYERDLTVMCETILGVHPIGVRDDLFDLGLDSLGAVQLVAHIDKVYGEDLPPATLFHSPTVAQLAMILRQGGQLQSWRSLVPIQPRGSKPPFFWIHGDSSGVFLPRYLGPDQPVYGLEHQSQDGTRAEHTHVKMIASYYFREIKTVQGAGPYFLGGFSFGAVVALELAQQIHDRGEEVALLVLLDPPSLSRIDPDVASVRITDAASPCSLRTELKRHVHNLGQLEAGQQVRYVLSRSVAKITESRTATSLRKTLRRAVWTIYLKLGRRVPLTLRGPYILDVYNRARKSHVPHPYRGRVILFKATNRMYDPERDWEQLMEGDVEIHEITAEHLQLRQKSYVQLWAPKLKECLMKVQELRKSRAP